MQESPQPENIIKQKRKETRYFYGICMTADIYSDILNYSRKEKKKKHSRRSDVSKMAKYQITVFWHPSTDKGASMGSGRPSRNLETLGSPRLKMAILRRLACSHATDSLTTGCLVTEKGTPHPRELCHSPLWLWVCKSFLLCLLEYIFRKYTQIDVPLALSHSIREYP